MKTRIVVIAETKEAGETRYPGAAAIVTPRSPHAARGIVADRVVVMDAMRDHDKLDELLAETEASTATSRVQKVRANPLQRETFVGL